MQIKINQVYNCNLSDICKYYKKKFDLIYADVLYDAIDWSELFDLIFKLRPGGALFLQTDYRSVAECKVWLDSECKELEFINWIIWPYDWGGRPKDAFGRKHDDILYYCKKRGKRTFNSQDISIPKVALINSVKEKKIPTDVWSDIGNFYTTSAERLKIKDKCIRWQKPENLLTRIILAASNPGDLIFEPYLGTGTACAVAKKLGRNYLGCDINKQLVKIAERRLKLIDAPEK